MMEVIGFIVIVVNYLSTLSNSIYGGDAGDLVSAILTKGFAHPPGYPLYTLLGIFFNKIPFASLTAAGKVTLVSVLAHFLSLIVIYCLIKELFEKKLNRLTALIVIFTLAFNYLIWLYAIVPEVFPLNSLITLLIFYSSVRFAKTAKWKYIFLLFFLIGLGITHHHTFIFILPASAYLVYKRLKKIEKKPLTKLFALSFCFLIIGLLPLLQLYIARVNLAKVIWGNTNNFSGFLALLLREGYGTFVPGPFISNLALHRFVQLLNLLIFVYNDFNIIGSLLLVIGLIYLIFGKYLKREYKLAVLLSLFLFGPFFVFYANFPLRIDFEFATVERFLIVFYFLLAIPLYIGIDAINQYINSFSQKLIANKDLGNFLCRAVMLLLFIYPLGLGFKNLKTINTLKNSRIAENLGIDTIQNAVPKSLILLASDTILFDTQYVYYSEIYPHQDKYVIHANKLNLDYYRASLKKNYPNIKIPASNSLSEFIRANIGAFSIYSNDKYPLKDEDYEWVPQGLLFKLEKNSAINDQENYDNLLTFWANSKNKNLAQDVEYNRRRYFNFFNGEIARAYAIAHQNTAFYYLQNNDLPGAFSHLNEAYILTPDDNDILYLFSKYYAVKSDCNQAKNIILKALGNQFDPMYLQQLQDVGETCYKNNQQKQEVKKRVEEIKRLNSQTVESL